LQKDKELAVRRNTYSSESRIKYDFPDMSAYMNADTWDLGIDEELLKVDRRMRELVQSSQKILTDVALHVIVSGGKRLRPSLSIIAHHSLSGNDMAKVVDIAAALELIHSATLIHDDINDGADMRRGKKAAYKQFGMHESIVAGDFMFARAFYIGGSFDKDIIDMVANCCKMLAEGEMMQYFHRGNPNLTVDDYIKIINGKTAHPIRAAAQVGAQLANGGKVEIDSFGEYGLNLGIAFQIVDDILDIVGDEEQLGKMTGSDLREGNMTLPVILARDNDEEVSKSLSRVLGSRDIERAEIVAFLEKVRESDAIDSAMKIAREYASRAAEFLERIPASVHRDKLDRLTRMVIDRTS